MKLTKLFNLTKAELGLPKDRGTKSAESCFVEFVCYAYFEFIRSCMADIHNFQHIPLPNVGGWRVRQQFKDLPDLGEIGLRYRREYKTQFHAYPLEVITGYQDWLTDDNCLFNNIDTPGVADYFINWFTVRYRWKITKADIRDIGGHVTTLASLEHWLLATYEDSIERTKARNRIGFYYFTVDGKYYWFHRGFARKLAESFAMKYLSSNSPDYDPNTDKAVWSGRKSHIYKFTQAFHKLIKRAGIRYSRVTYNHISGYLVNRE
jgi:hypothetical protein